MEKFCFDLPKIELHAHLNGSLSEKTLKTLGCRQENVFEYQKLTTILNKTARTLEECFELFRLAHNATDSPEKVHIATTTVLEEFEQDNCIYLELRTTPRSSLNMSKQEYIEAVVSAITSFKGSMLTKLLLSIDRRHDENISYEVLDLILAAKKKYPNVIVGVDLCGNPKEGQFLVDIFTKARKHGLKITLHCGEVENDDEVVEMLTFAPDRIGHGTYLLPIGDHGIKLWELYLKKPIPLECCLTSNIVCGTVGRYQDHHVKRFLKEKLPFSLSTDDKGVFCTSLTNEYYLAQRHFELSELDLWKISWEAVDQTFASTEEKNILYKILSGWRNKNIS